MFLFSNGVKDPNPFDDESEEWDDGDGGKVFFLILKIMILF